MEEILITGGVSIATSTISAIVTWVLARRKYNSEVNGNIIANMEKSLDFYEKLSNDNKTRLDKILEDNKSMSNEVETLTNTNKELKESVDTLKQENKELKRSLSELKTQLINLTSQICMDLTCQLRNQDFSTLNIGKIKK